MNISSPSALSRRDFLKHSGQVAAVSALAGDNVVARSASMPWYQGPTVLEVLETVEVSHDVRLADLRATTFAYAAAGGAVSETLAVTVRQPLAPRRHS